MIGAVARALARHFVILAQHGGQPQRFEVMGQRHSRHAAKERERRHNRVKERLGGLVWIGLQEAGTRLRQVYAQEVDILTDATDHADRLVKNHLRMARRVCHSTNVSQPRTRQSPT